MIPQAVAATTGAQVDGTAGSVRPFDAAGRGRRGLALLPRRAERLRFITRWFPVRHRVRYSSRRGTRRSARSRTPIGPRGR